MILVQSEAGWLGASQAQCHPMSMVQRLGTRVLQQLDDHLNRTPQSYDAASTRDESCGSPCSTETIPIDPKIRFTPRR